MIYVNEAAVVVKYVDGPRLTLEEYRILVTVVGLDQDRLKKLYQEARGLLELERMVNS
jgi:hypothetical protein